MSELQPILVPISQASAIIGKCRRGIYHLIATGQLKAVKSGRSTLVVYESLKQYAANLPVAKFRAPHGATPTTSIPIIAIDLETDPVASGLVASLARPGRNVSRSNTQGCRGAWDPSTGSLQRQAVEAAAQGFGVSAQVFEARRAADIAEAFYTVDRSRIQGVLMLSSPLIAGSPQMIADLAMRRNIPTIALFPEIARAGGLLAYGPDIRDLFRQVGAMARKVLYGANVSELPAERPTRFQLVANLKTAKLMGITLPSSILLRADEVIE